MAIQFARVEYVGRSDGKNACCKGSYNARTKITDERTNVTYDFSKRKDNVYHTILLPDHVDKKFKDPSELMNAVEHIERKENSQLLKECVLALPDDEGGVSLDIKKEMVHEFIRLNKWVKEGLAVQVDIHEPHVGEQNWHAHLLVTTRRFTKDGQRLGKKARDLEPQVRGGRDNTYVKSKEEVNLGKLWADVQNDIFKKHGLENRVDAISLIPQEHIGAVRMRSVLNKGLERNEERRIADVESLQTGDDLIAKVTKNSSVFTRADLMKATKYIPDYSRRVGLVDEAMQSDSMVRLCDDHGNDVDFYTSKEVRLEEKKLQRLSGYIAERQNVIKSYANSFNVEKNIKSLIEEQSDLSAEQRHVLTHLMLGEQGIRIVQGRAGSGKSRVLGKVATLSNYTGIDVIGLSPTHKARTQLAECGYSNNDTVKGFLFKLHNGRADIPRNGLIVVDEAAMVGNDDYLELMRVAASGKCNIILSGDERQLSSIGRGGMFSVYADQYGYSELSEIHRQNTGWGKAVSNSFANGEFVTGANILKSESRLDFADTKLGSMGRLLSDWHNSDHPLENRLIISVKNIDVDLLNAEARELLKASGHLKGEEYIIREGSTEDFYQESCLFMQGDRIVFTKSNKELGVSNGDFGNITKMDGKIIKVKLDNGKVIRFDPLEYADFKHCYATTIYKAQGASIKDVYVLHNGFSGSRNSYVAMSRHIEDLHLYANKEATRDERQLILQLSLNPEHGASINYKTKSELAEHEKVMGQNVFTSAALGVFEYAKEKIEKYSDMHGKNAEYYNFVRPPRSKIEVEEILNLVHEYKENTDSKSGDNDNRGDENNENSNEQKQREKLVVGGNIYQNQNEVVLGKDEGFLHKPNNDEAHSVIAARKDFDDSNIKNDINSENNVNTNLGIDNILPNKAKDTQKSVTNNNSPDKIRMSAKERFYANVDFVRKQKQWELNREKYQENYRGQVDHLRSEMRFKAESIARDLLGDPNKKLSNGHTLKYGNKGSLVVKIMGEKSGTWYDFSKGEGGDLFDLVQDTKKCDFKESVSYIQSHLGISYNQYESSSNIANDNSTEDKYISYAKNVEAQEKSEAVKAKKVEKLYVRAKDIKDSGVASKYLSEKRGVSCDLGDDIKKANIYVVRDSGDSKQQKGKYLPAIVAFARNREGDITGGQQIILDKKTNDKANIAVPKKSFGKISGAFVDIGEVGNSADKQSAITIIAEGIETALSVKQALGRYKNANSNNKNWSVVKAKNIRVICSLGVHNIKNYEPKLGERIIIAADNDGTNSNSEKLIEKAAAKLSKNAMVVIVSPKEHGDFNDILKQDIRTQDKPDTGADIDNARTGEHEIQKCFEPAISKLAQYNKEEISVILQLQSQQKSDQNNINQNKVIYDSKLEYEQNSQNNEHNKARDKDNSSVDKFLQKYEVANQFAEFAKNYDLSNLKAKLAGFNDVIKQKLVDIELKKVIENYASIKMNGFKQDRLQSKNIVVYLKTVKKEKEFAFNLYNSQRQRLASSKSKIIKSIRQQNNMYKDNPSILKQFKTHHDNAFALGIYKSPANLLYKIKHSSKPIDKISSIIKKDCREGIIPAIKRDMGIIDNGHLVGKGKSVFSDNRSLLNYYKTEPICKLYVQGFVKSQIKEINRTDQLNKAHEQELQNQQQPKIEKTKSKDYGFSM